MFKTLHFDPKDPSETRPYMLDFALDLDVERGETIVGTPTVSITSATESQPTLTAATPTIDGTWVATIIAGGTVNVIYSVRFTITTSGDKIIPRSVILPVENR